MSVRGLVSSAKSRRRRQQDIRKGLLRADEFVIGLSSDIPAHPEEILSYPSQLVLRGLVYDPTGHLTVSAGVSDELANFDVFAEIVRNRTLPSERGGVAPIYGTAPDAPAELFAAITFNNDTRVFVLPDREAAYLQLGEDFRWLRADRQLAEQLSTAVRDNLYPHDPGLKTMELEVTLANIGPAGDGVLSDRARLPGRSSDLVSGWTQSWIDVFRKQAREAMKMRKEDHAANRSDALGVAFDGDKATREASAYYLSDRITPFQDPVDNALVVGGGTSAALWAMSPEQLDVAYLLIQHVPPTVLPAVALGGAVFYTAKKAVNFAQALSRGSRRQGRLSAGLAGDLASMTDAAQPHKGVEPGYENNPLRRRREYRPYGGVPSALPPAPVGNVVPGPER